MSYCKCVEFYVQLVLGIYKIMQDIRGEHISEKLKLGKIYKSTV